MTRVLVTGGTGFVGWTLCPALLAAGHEVCVSSRNPRAAEAMDGVEVRPVSDLGPDTGWGAALDGVEAVVHLAARVHVTEDRSADPLSEYRRVNTDGTRRLAEAAASAGVRRLVFLSTIKVNGETTGAAPFSESDPAAPGDAYAVSKCEAETALFGIAAQGPMEAVVLRPPLVYGQRVGGNFLALLKICRLAPPLPLGGVSNRRSLIYAGNLADAIIRCLAHADAAGRTFLVRDGDDVSTPELIRRVGAALGRPARLFPVPAPLLRAAGRATGKSEIVTRLLDSLRVDDGQIRRDLGWAPPFTMAQGLDATAAWFTSRDGS